MWVVFVCGLNFDLTSMCYTETYKIRFHDQSAIWSWSITHNKILIAYSYTAVCTGINYTM